MKIRAAKSFDDMLKIMIIRGIVFMGEQHHKYLKEYDADDFNGRIQLLAHDNEEPVGTMRIHKDGNTAKFERLALLPDYRGEGNADRLIEAGYEYCRREGVENVCLFCKPELIKYWNQRGYQRVGGDKILKDNQLLLVPMMRRLDAGKPLTKEEIKQIPQIMAHQKGEWIEGSASKMALILQNRNRSRS